MLPYTFGFISGIAQEIEENYFEKVIIEYDLDKSEYVYKLSSEDVKTEPKGKLSYNFSNLTERAEMLRDILFKRHGINTSPLEENEQLMRVTFMIDRTQENKDKIFPGYG